MKKTVLVMLLLTSLVASVFAQGTNEQRATAKPAGPTHINMWYNATQTEVGPLPNDWTGYKILKDKMNIELEASSLPSSTTDQDMKVQAAAAADELPDFFVASREVWLRLVQNGMVADVSDLYDKMPNRTKLMFDKDAIGFTTINGKSYGFATPSTITKNEGLLIRKDWLDKLGLQVPKTTDDLLKVAHAFTYNDPDGNGKNDTWGYGAFIEETTYESYPGRRFEPIMGAFGVEGTWNMTKANFGLQLRKPEFYDFMVYMKKLIDDGAIDPNWMAYKKDDFRAAWKQGKFGIMREQNAAYAASNNYAPFDANFPNGEWMVIDPISGPTSKASVGPLTRGLRIWCISQKAADAGKKDKIAEMFEWMSHDEGYLLCGWGVEGVNYTIVDGIPQSVAGDIGFEGPVGQTYIQLRSMAFNYASNTELQSRYPTYKAKTSGKTMSALAVLKDMQTRKWTNAMGSDSMPVPSTDLKTFYQKGLAEFFTGKKELTKDNWNAFIAGFDKIGGAEWEKAGREYAEKNNLLN